MSLQRNLACLVAIGTVFCLNANASPRALDVSDPLAAIDLNRNAIIADIVQGFEGDRAALAKRLAGLRSDRLLSASLASTRESLESILDQAEKSRDAAVSRASAKALGSPTADLVYTPLTPCRLIDTRGFGAPIQGGAFAPNARRSYTPNGLCSLPVTGVASMLVSFTTQNLTPNSGGYLAILAPAAPVTASVDVFNLGSEWSASNTAVITGAAAQFDVLVAGANAHVVIDVLGYFAPPQGGAVTSVTAGTGLTGGTITSTGTIGLASTYQLPQSCTNGQLAQSNGAGSWNCASPVVSGGTVTGVTASAPLASSGGNAPNITLTGAIPVANGGTGQAALATNGIVYGQGTAAVGTVVGTAGEVLTGTAGAPAWTSSPSISGNLTLAASTATTGNIMKGGARFIHTTGNSNTFVGVNAGNFTTTGSFNTANGVNALASNGSGGANTAVGLSALFSNTSGGSNTANGFGALSSNTTASGNTATGAGALQASSTGVGNTANGAYALTANVNGNGNTASGSNTLFKNTSGTSNTAGGATALFENTIGNDNTAFGVAALRDNTGNGNTAVGHDALLANTTGSNNTALGIDAGRSLTTGSFNIAIGHFGITGESATTRLGSANQTRTFISGIRGVTTGVANGIAVLIDSAGQLGTISSSRRFKDNIADMDVASSALMKLRPVTFNYKADRNGNERALEYGLIAEEVQEVYPGLVAHSADGQVETVMYQYLPAMMLNEMQKQQRLIEDLRAQMARMAKKLEQFGTR